MVYIDALTTPAIMAVLMTNAHFANIKNCAMAIISVDIREDVY